MTVNIANINLGSGPDTNTGEPLRSAFNKINNNFSNLKSAVNGVAANGNVVSQQVSGTVANFTSYRFANSNSILSNISTVGFTGNYADLTNKPTLISTFTNDSGYIKSSYVTWGNVTGKPTALSQFSNDTDFADVSYVNSRITNLIGGAPAALDTLKEISDSLANNTSLASTLTAQIATKANANAAISSFTNDAGYITKSTANVISINGQTGAVTLNVSAYSDSNVTTLLHNTSSTFAGNIAKNGYTWAFGNDGILIFPDNTNQSTAYTGPQTSLTAGLAANSTINTSATVTTNHIYANPIDFVSDVNNNDGTFIAGMSQRNPSQIEVDVFADPDFATFLLALPIGRTVELTYSTASGDHTFTSVLSQAFSYVSQYDPDTMRSRYAGRVDGTLPVGYTGLVSINFPVVATKTQTLTFDSVGNLTLPNNMVFTASPAISSTGIVFGDGTFQNTAWTGNTNTTNGFINFTASAIGHFQPAGTITTNGTISTTGGVVAGNVYTSGNVSASNYLWTNGASILSGIVSSYGDSNVVSLLSSLGSNAITTTGNIAGGNLTLGSSASSLRQTGSNATVTLGGSITLTPDTSADALAGVKIAGNGYLLGPNSARNAVLNYGSSSVMGIYALNVYGNTAAAITNGGSTGVGNIGASTGRFNTVYAVAGDFSGNVTAGNISSNVSGYAIGYRDIPQVSLSSNVTLAATDAGKHYYSANATATLTIPNNTVTSFSIGTAITIVQQGSANITVAPGSGVTLYMAGNSTSGSRTLSNYGMATLMKVATNTWFINGSGLA